MKEPAYAPRDDDDVSAEKTVFEGKYGWISMLIIMVFVFLLGFLIKGAFFPVVKEKIITVPAVSTEKSNIQSTMPTYESNKVAMRVLDGKYIIREVDEMDVFVSYEISMFDLKIPLDSLSWIVSATPRIKNAIKDSLNKYQIPFTYRVRQFNEKDK
jgi:hypothetical protein